MTVETCHLHGAHVECPGFGKPLGSLFFGEKKNHLHGNMCPLALAMSQRGLLALGNGRALVNPGCLCPTFVKTHFPFPC